MEHIGQNMMVLPVQVLTARGGNGMTIRTLIRSLFILVILLLATISARSYRIAINEDQNGVSMETLSSVTVAVTAFQTYSSFLSSTIPTLTGTNPLFALGVYG